MLEASEVQISKRIEKLRELMKENQMDAYIVSSFDAHQSEYVAKHWKGREWLSGFTGSAGTVVVTLDDAGLWTDGRYYIQAEKQLKGSGIQLFRMMDPGVPFYSEWLAQTLEEGSTVGFYGETFSVRLVERMKKDFAKKNIGLNIENDFLDVLWTDRPELPQTPLFLHDLQYAGKSVVEKLKEVRAYMHENKVSHYLLSSLDDIAWLLNIRGSDVPNNPVVIANVIVTQEVCYLFVDSKKVPHDVKMGLEASGIKIDDYRAVYDVLSQLSAGQIITFDAEKTNVLLEAAIPAAVKKMESSNVTTRLKAVKNPIEIQNMKNALIRDGIAMVKFIKWMKENIATETITEIDAENQLEAFRNEQDNFVGPSFDTIAGYKDHAALMHYKAAEDTQYQLENKGFFLVDSGGQYLDGTTDITRTIVLGEVTERQKRDYTLVLQGFIALSRVKFLHGATGAHLDVLARQPIWQHGIDYKCGTGHGVGFFLNVHEGPQSIRTDLNPIVLEQGMILTNEPGIYLEGQYGIRIENMLVVAEAEKTEFGQFMEFETMTYCPIDLAGIDVSMLTASEKDWLNSYHQTVYEVLAPSLSEDEKKWLANETREI